MNGPTLVQLVGGLAVLGAGIGLTLKGNTQVGVAMILAGAGELGVKVAAIR